MFSGVRCKIRGIAHDILHGRVGKEATNFAQITLHDAHVLQLVLCNGLHKQVSRAGLELQTGDGQVIAPAQQGECTRAAAKVEHAGTFWDAGEGREQDGVLTELKKTVVL